MADIFLSYSNVDQATVRRFAEAFEHEGFSVWWDAALRSGEAYDEKIEQALRQARAVVVLWSKTSVASRWVRAEATLADRNKTLVPVMIEECERPIMFELTQTAALANWSGATDDPAWRSLLADVQRFVKEERSGSAAESHAVPVSTAPAPPPAQAKRASVPADKTAVAILPFLDLNSAKDQAPFVEGLQEEINTALSRDPSLALVTPDPDATMNASTRDLKRIARTLGVAYLLDGSVRGTGGRLRVTAKLVAPIEGEQLWTERFDSNPDEDEFAFQERVASSVASQLDEQVIAAEIRRIQSLPEKHRTAYDLYLLAMSLYRSFDRASFFKALDLLSQASALDPESALVHSLAAGVYVSLYMAGWSDNEDETRRLGIEHSRAAFVGGHQDARILINCAAAQMNFGLDLAALDTMFDRALARTPEDAGLWQMAGWVKVFLGKKTEQALSSFQKALDLGIHPTQLYVTLHGKAASLFHLRRYDEAIPLVQEVCMRIPNYLLAQCHLTASLAHAGRQDEARAAFSTIPPNTPFDRTLAMLRDADDRELLRGGLAMAGAEV